MKNAYDIVVLGAGIVGATAAALLSQQSSLKIAVLESQHAPAGTHRVSAISPASKHIFQQADVWDSICSHGIAPYQHMQVWDESGKGEIRFDCASINAPALGYIVEDDVMRASLAEKLMQTDFIHPVRLISCAQRPEHVELMSDDGRTFTAKLLIAADGAHSWARAQAGIELKTWDYGQTAIVVTVQTELPHAATARQRFLATGPLAFLPLRDMNSCSIVWSATHEYAHELLSLDDETFQQRLGTAFAGRAGDILKAGQRHHFPLHMRHAKKYVHERTVLVGDAAHTIHPLAGQGVNLGLLDAACLVEVILEALAKRKDFSRPVTLRRYERRRKSDNLIMLAAVEILKKLFAQENKFIRNVRNTGLNFADRMPWIRNFLMDYALGNRKDLP